MTIEISDKLYTQIKNVAGIEGVSEKDIPSCIEESLKDAFEIVPTAEEKKEWKGYLYNTLWFLAMERPELAPRKKDSLETLKDSFFYWADEYNDGYFSEQDKASTDKYCAWLVQEHRHA